MASFMSVHNGEATFLSGTSKIGIKTRQNQLLNALENQKLALEQVNIGEKESASLRNLIAQTRSALQDQEHGLSAAQETLDRLIIRQNTHRIHLSVENISKLDTDLVEGLSRVANDIARDIESIKCQITAYEQLMQELRQRYGRLESEKEDWELTVLVARESVSHLNDVIQKLRVDTYVVDLPTYPVTNIPDPSESVWTRILQRFMGAQLPPM